MAKSKAFKSPKRQKHQATQKSAKFKSTAKQSKRKHNPPPPSNQTVPFDVFDSILLVGEGDFSFAASLLHDHGCADILATTFDSHPTCLAKYPHAKSHISSIEDAFAPSGVAPPENGRKDTARIIYSVDATKLSSTKHAPSAPIRRRAPFDRIFFNFPHVGGLSSDVNRQVRANQALLSGFFTAAKSLLYVPGGEDYSRSSNEEGGTILVTLFESEPYTLWNVRDIARNAGLAVKRSWRFDATVYPLYRHARTLGVVRKGGEEGEVSESAWRGEERAARMCEFGLKSDDHRDSRRKGDSSDDDDDD